MQGLRQGIFLVSEDQVAGELGREHDDDRRAGPLLGGDDERIINEEMLVGDAVSRISPLLTATWRTGWIMCW